MSLDLLPPANEDVAEFEVSDRKINVTSVVLGCYIFFVIYPAYELLRYMWGATPSMFSWSSTLTAAVCGVLFGLNVRRRVKPLSRI